MASPNFLKAAGTRDFVPPHLVRIGTAGWSIARELAPEFPGEGSHLARYAGRLQAAEINSSFYRPHRIATYARWATSVPLHFRFSVKLPRTITHQRRLIDCGALLDAFAIEIAGLGARRGPVLVQLPPSLAFDRQVAGDFFAAAMRTLGGPIVCEPRHASWFGEDADRLLAEAGVARVAADPAIVPAAALPGGYRGLAYFRLHGSPVLYRSNYDDAALDRLSAALRTLTRAGIECWTIFDNTASGAALPNTLALCRRIADWMV